MTEQPNAPKPKQHRNRQRTAGQCLKHPDRPAKAKGLCASCYISEWQRRKRKERKESKTPSQEAREQAPQPVRVETGKISIGPPEAMALVVRASIKHQCNLEKALQDIAPELTPSEIGAEAARIGSDSRYLMALELALAPRGLDEASKQDFVSTMWGWLRMGDKDHSIAAARILGRGFIAEKAGAEKPEELRIQGFEDGIRYMLGEDEPSDPLPVPLHAPKQLPVVEAEVLESEPIPELVDVRCKGGDPLPPEEAEYDDDVFAKALGGLE